MTRSERRKVAYEAMKTREAEAYKRCVTSETICESCKECANNTKIPIDYDFFACRGEKWICKCKARLPMTVYIEEDNKIKGATIGGYPYGDVSGKCESLCFMHFQDEKQ